MARTVSGVEAPLTPKPPVLAGQHVDYLEQALTAYRNGRRKNVVMDGMAQLLTSDEDVKIVAAYFSSQPSPLVTATHRQQVARRRLSLGAVCAHLPRSSGTARTPGNRRRDSVSCESRGPRRSPADTRPRRPGCALD